MADPIHRRDERIAQLADALQGGETPGTLVRISFSRLDPSTSTPLVGLGDVGIEEVGMAVHDLPAGQLRLDMYTLLQAATGRPTGSTTGEKGWSTAARDQRADELRALGWVVDPAARRTVEIDPADPASLGQVVDDIGALIDVSARIAGVPGADQATWEFHRVPVQPQAAGSVPRDEPWHEDATEIDLRTRIVRLAGLRDGRIVVRSPLVPIAQLELTARRRGDRISVRGSDDLSSWRGRWTVEGHDPYVGGILEDLRRALARHEPDEQGPLPLSLRIERYDEAAGRDAAAAYVLVGSWVAAIIAAAVGAAALGHPAVTLWLDEATRLASDQGGALVLLVGVAFTAFFPVMLAWLVAESICGRLRIPYAISDWVDFAAGTAGGLAFIAFLGTTGDRTLLVIAATWVIGIVALAGPGLIRRVRSRGGRRR